MFRTPSRALCVLVTVISLGPPANAANGASMATISSKISPGLEVPLTVGWKKLDLSSDGTVFYVLGQFNDVYTAHSNNTYTFVDSKFRSVLFEPGKMVSKKLAFPGIHSRSITTQQGADFQLASVRLLIDHKKHESFVIYAVRDFGQTYVDSEPVTIELFKLETLPRDPGNSPAAFVLVDMFRTTKCYTDSNNALVTELGLLSASGEHVKGDFSEACTSQ